MTSQLQILVRPSNYVYCSLMSHGTTCGKRGRIFGSILYQIVSCITEYLEFRQFVQHALLVEPLLRGYLRGGGGGGAADFSKPAGKFSSTRRHSAPVSLHIFH